MLFSTIAINSLLGPTLGVNAQSAPLSQSSNTRSLDTSIGSQSQSNNNLDTKPIESSSQMNTSATDYKSLIDTKKFGLIEDDNILKSLSVPLDNYTLSSGNVLRNIPGGTKAINMVGNQQLNTGADLAVPSGTPVKASAAGKVVEAKTGYNGGYGNYVLVQHDINGQQVFTRYSHLSDISEVKAGQDLTQGQVLGKSGNSGNTTKISNSGSQNIVGQTGNGNHLDFEAFIRGEGGKPLFIKTDSLYNK